MRFVPRSTASGFSMIEVLIALFIFAVVMLSVSHIFAMSFGNYRQGRQLQENLEDAQAAMNTMAKVLRTSTIVAAGSIGKGQSGETRDITGFDYSQSRCIRYRITSNQIQYGSMSGDPANPSSCNVPTSSLSSITGPTTFVVDSGSSGSNFSIQRSDDTPSSRTVGRVTIKVIVKPFATSPREAVIQTSVSLRDYNQSGLF